MPNLRSKLIHLASTNPELRETLLPLLKKTAAERTKEEIVRKFMHGETDNWDIGNELPSIIRQRLRSPPDQVEVADLTSDEVDTDAVVDLTWHIAPVGGTRGAEVSITLTYPFHWSSDDEYW